MDYPVKPENIKSVSGGLGNNQAIGSQLTRAGENKDGHNPQRPHVAGDGVTELALLRHR